MKLQQILELINRHERECSCLLMHSYQELFTNCTEYSSLTTRLRHTKNGNTVSIVSTFNETYIIKNGEIVDKVHAKKKHPIPQT